MPSCETERVENEKSAVIVGGGISGLTAAYTLLRAAEAANKEVSITLVEPSKSLGGAIKTLRHEGLVLDVGPECFVASKPAVHELAGELGIQDRIITQAQRKTYIARGNSLCNIPDGFISMRLGKISDFLKSDLFSIAGKFRMVCELFVPRQKKADDESLSSFVKRRFGSEVLDRLAEPVFGGLYGSAPETLSAKAILPRFVDMENSSGSVILGLLKEKIQSPSLKTPNNSASAQHAAMATFDRGMSVLVEELEKYIQGKCLVVRDEVTSIAPGKDKDKWEICLGRGDKIEADATIVAVPASAAAKVLARTDKQLSQSLGSIKYSSPVVVNLIYNRHAVGHSLRGSGFLVPRRERRSLRACTFSSSKFKRRTPEDLAVIRVSLDTLQAEHLSDRTDEEIKSIAGADLQRYLQIQESPLKSVVTRHKNAIPQLSPGHEELLDKIETKALQFPNLALVGNAYGGMGVSDCVNRARQETRRIAADLFS